MLLRLGMMICPAEEIIRYDCSGDRLNTTTLSLIEVGNCNNMQPEPVETNVTLQVIHLLDYRESHVKHCKVIEDSNITHCGWHSHSSLVQFSKKEYVHPMTFATCDTLHKHGSMMFGQAFINEIKPNDTAR